MVASAAIAGHRALPAGAAARFSPLGLPLEVEADTPAVLDIVADALSGWQAEAQGASLRLAMTTCRPQAPLGEVQAGVEGRRLSIRGPGAEGWADAASGQATCRLSTDYLRYPARLRDELLDPLLLFLLTAKGRAPVHAAGCMIGRTALLFAGPSGAGKSCLAHAALREGFRLLSDDTVYVQLEPRFRVWGIPRPVHLFPGDAPAHAGPPRLRNGKLKRPVLPSRPGTAASADAAVLCVLGRADTAALRPIAPSTACAMLHRLEPGFDLLASQVRAANAALARNGAWQLDLSADPADAIALVARNIARLEATAAP